MERRQGATSRKEERQRAVLGAVVRANIACGSPVSSKTVVETADCGVSAATVRTVMAELEELGYLTQPHPSSGRVPTEMGYREYARIQLERLSARSPADASPALPVDLMRRGGELTTFLHETSRMLSALSRCVGVVLQPRFEQTVLRSLHFFRLGSGRVVVVVVGAGDFVAEKVVRRSAEDDDGQDELDRMANYISNRFRGSSLVEVYRTIERELEDGRLAYAAGRRQLLELALSCLEGSVAKDEVYVGGAASCVEGPEFDDVERVRQLLRAYEQKDRIARLLRRCLARDGVQIRIGCEGDDGEDELTVLPGLAFVASPYGDGARPLGSVGVLGPARMPYDHVIAIVDRVARDVSSALKAGLSVSN